MDNPYGSSVTVAELIYILQQQPRDAMVILEGFDDYGGAAGSEVYVTGDVLITRAK